jgi:hypothetical protein
MPRRSRDPAGVFPWLLSERPTPEEVRRGELAPADPVQEYR